MSALGRAAWWVVAVAGITFAMFSPLLIVRDLRWLYVVIPVLLAYTLWVMREYQKWGRSRRPWR